MEVLLSVLAGILVAASVYMMMHRNLIKFLFGLVLLSNAANVVLFTAGRLMENRPAFVPKGLKVPEEMVANPLPQALILTAIVISFGLMAFALVLAYRNYQETGSVDMDELGVDTRLNADDPEQPMQLKKGEKA